jgi:hypothetical protein
MRLYTAESMETLRTRKLLKEWTTEGVLTGAQYQHLEAEVPSQLRTTNIFLRGVLFLFTLFVVAAAAALFSVIFLNRASTSAQGILCLSVAVLSYLAAEWVVSQYHLYHHGIEEALVVCSIGCFYLGLQITQDAHSTKSLSAEFLIPGACIILSLWAWHRLGYWYAFLAAMIFVVFLPDYWTSSHSAQRTIIAAAYIAGLMTVAALRSRHSVDSMRDAYSLVEALLWGGLYLVTNLKVLASGLPLHWWGRGTQASSDFPRPFYWLTWVLIWCLPPLILPRGVRWKDRPVMAVGIAAAILTFISNKPYLSWQRHTWDPIILGVLLACAVLLLRRWLSQGPGGVREGFTAARLTARDQSWISAGSTVLGLASLHSVTPSPQTINSGPYTGNPGLHSGGGASGGAGASGDF